MVYTLYVYCIVGTMLYKESIAFNLLEDKPTFQIHRYLVYTEADKSSKTLGDIDNRMITEEAMWRRVICDGLLCSILHALSGSASPNKEEFISVMQRECDEEDLMKSWKMLFTFYKDVHCDTEKKPIIQI